MTDCIRVFAFAFGVMALLSCTSLPDYAAPKGAVMDPKLIDASDLISYRTLERNDFKATAPPRRILCVSERIGAATCSYVRTEGNSMLTSRSVRAPDGSVTYEVTAPADVRFVASMNRSCSWWNPKDIGLPQDYILEHEQIHFAIFELEARRLTASFTAHRAELTATADSAQEAGDIVRKKLEAHLQEHLADILDRSRDFDEDTSMGHSPEQQKVWLTRVGSELAATEGQ